MRGKSANGEGSVYQRSSDGKWVAAAYVPVTTGGRRRVAKYGATRAEASDRLREVLDNAAKNIPVVPKSPTLASYFEDWLTYIRPLVRPKTWSVYAGNVHRHIIPRIGRKKLTNLSVRDVRLFVEQMRAEGVTPHMTHSVHCTLRSALEQATREELISRNVATRVRVPQPVATTVQEPWTVEEAVGFLRAIRGDRFEAMWTVVLMMGLRRSEACALTWDDIDFEHGSLRVSKSLHRTTGQGLQVFPTKTARSNRTVPMPSRVRYALAQHHAAVQGVGAEPGRPARPTGPVFGIYPGQPIDPGYMTEQFGALLQKHGVRKVRLHDLRHTCVSLLLSLGVNPRIVMEIAGHSRIEMTMNIYGHVTVDNQRAALDALDDELGT